MVHAVVEAFRNELQIDEEAGTNECGWRLSNERGGGIRA